MDAIRKRVLQALKERNLDMKAVSLEMGHNHAYLQQFIHRNTPAKLKEADRSKLSEILDIPEDELGSPRRPAPAVPRAGIIDEIDVTAGLGGGGLAITENTTQNGITFHKEAVRDYWRLPDSMLARFNAQPQHIKAFGSRGDSMFPDIADGDVVFADTRHRVPSPAGVYVLADQFGGVVVKNLEVVSRPNDEPVIVRISSTNPKYRDQELTLDEIIIIGIYVGRFTTQ